VNSEWEQAFLPGLVPSWIRAFGAEPAKALDSLLRDEFYRGTENLLEPSEALIRWSAELTASPDFGERLDAELQRWIRAAPVGELGSARRGWKCACEIMASVTGLTRASGVLRERFANAVELLDEFGVDAADDLFDATVTALAETQIDQSLLPLWQTLIRLQGDTPVDRGVRGLLALDSMGVAAGSQRTGFREDVVDALITYAQALAQRVNGNRLSEKRAMESLASAVALLTARQPHPHRWTVSMARRKVSGQPARWLKEAGLEPGAINESEETDDPMDAQPPAWGSVGELGLDLRMKALDASRTGDEERALSLSGEALQLDPWSPFSWTIRVDLLRKAGSSDLASSLAWQARERFPQDPVTWHLLGSILEDLRRFALAEEIYTEAYERFPEHEQIVNSLARLLAVRSDPESAIRMLEEYLLRHPGRHQPEVTLADAYRRHGMIHKAENLMRPFVEAGSMNPYDWSSLVRILRDSSRLQEAEEVRAQARVRFAGNPHFKGHQEAPVTAIEAEATRPANLSVAEVAMLRRRARRLEARGRDVGGERTELADAIADAKMPAATKAFERSLLLLDSGDVDGALDLLGGTRANIGESARVLYATSRAYREHAESQGSQFSSGAFRNALEPLGALRERTTQGRVLAALGAYRLGYVMRDGQALEERRREVGRQLDRELQLAGSSQDGERTFGSWWSSQVRGRTLGSTGGDSTRVAARLRVDQRVVDELEEEYVDKLVLDIAAA
jgi:tetratricopeptide (TPR) repeat protein